MGHRQNSTDPAKTPSMPVSDHVSVTVYFLKRLSTYMHNRMEFPTPINWIITFLFKGLWVDFIQILIENAANKQWRPLIKRSLLWRLIYVCTVCLRATKRTLVLYGLNKNKENSKQTHSWK